MKCRFVFVTVLFLLMIQECFAQGTNLVKDIHPGTESSTPVNFLKAGSNFYFSGVTTNFEFGLYKTDGTTPGTSLVAEGLNPRLYDPLRLKNAADYNGRLAFVNINSTSDNNELLVTDGTAAGTTTVAQLPLATHNNIELLTSFNNCLYYTLRSLDPNYVGLYKWDGTNPPIRILDLFNSISSVSVCQLIIGDTKLFFLDEYKVYDVTTNTPELLYDQLLLTDEYTRIGRAYYYNGKILMTEFSFSTSLLSNVMYGIRALDPVSKTYYKISPTTAFSGQSYITYYPTVVEMNDTIYFVNESYNPNSISLYKIDPLFNISLVKEIARPEPFFMGTMLVNNDKIIFTIESADISNNELWVSDGTDAGTFPLITLDDSIEVAHRQNKFVLLDNKLFFQARDLGTSNFNSPHGNELWMSDFTPSGTQLAVDFCQGEGFGIGHSNLIQFDNTSILLCAYRCSDVGGAPYGRELWITDGTSFNDVTSSVIKTTDYQLSIYPNPAVDHFIVEGTSENAIVSIYNFYGELLSETKIQQPKASIPLPSHKAECYFIKVEEGNKIFTTKINAY